MNIVECAIAEVHGVETQKFVDTRNSLCHPVVEGAVDNHQEEWLAGDMVLKTPIECGQHAYVYNGYTVLGAKSDDKVFVPCDMLRTPVRAEQVNNTVLVGTNASIMPTTWALKIGRKFHDLGGVTGFSIDNDNVVSFRGNDGREIDHKDYESRLKSMHKALKFYAEFLVGVVLDFNGTLSDVYEEAADEPSIIYSHATFMHGNMDQTQDDEFSRQIEEMMFIPDIITSALRVSSGTMDVSLTKKLKGKMIWDIKNNIINLCMGAQGFATDFRRV